MRRTFPLVLLVLSLAVMSGCQGVSKELTRRVVYTKSSHPRGQFNWETQQTYYLTDSKLHKMAFEGTIEIQDVNVSYQHGLEEQARCIADQINHLISHIEDATALHLRYGVKVYLLRVERVPQNIRMHFKMDCNDFIQPLFVQAGDESCEAVTSYNELYPTILAHEITEMSLIFAKDGGVVLPDVEGQLFLLTGRLLNYTRWFREGLGDYAAYLAYGMTSPKLEAVPKHGVGGRRPFSSLRKVGKDLFRWHQYSPSRLDSNYYDAALGLFLVLTDRFGQDAVRRVMLEVRKQRYLNGADLIAIINRTLKTDVEKLVEDFYFPQIGLTTAGLTKTIARNEDIEIEEGLFVETVEPNSLSDRAGFKGKDVILRIGGKPIRNNLDFELAVFEFLEEQNAQVTIWRKGVGETPIKLRLTN